MAKAVSCALFLSCGTCNLTFLMYYFFLCWHNLEKLLYLFIMSCVFLACCIVDSIFGFVNLWCWMPVKCQLMIALSLLDWFLTRFYWLRDNRDENFTSSEIYFWTIQAKHYTVYLYMYNLS